MSSKLIGFTILISLALTIQSLAQETHSPQWVRSKGRSLRYPEKYYLTGFGISDRQGELNQKYQQAQERALQDLARRIQVHIEAQIEDRWEEKTKGRKGKIESVGEGSLIASTRSSVNMILEGVNIERYEDKKTGIIYALAVLEKKGAAFRLRRKIEENEKTVAALFARGDSLQQAYAWRGALEAFASALMIKYQVMVNEGIYYVLKPTVDSFPSKISSTELEDQITSLLQAVRLQKVAGDSQALHINGQIKPLIVQAVMVSGNNQVPLANVPLIFQGQVGKARIYSTAVTDIEGRCNYSIGDFIPDGNRSYLVNASLNVDTLFPQSELSKFLSRIKTAYLPSVNFSLYWEPRTIEDKAADLVFRLQRSVPPDYQKAKVALGRFTLANSDVPSPFMHYFREELCSALTRFTDFSVIERDTMKQMIRTRSPILTRGPAPLTSRGISEVLAADLCLTASCWDLGKRVQVGVNVFSRKTQSRIASQKISFPRNLIPEKYPLEPPNFTQVKETLKILNKPLDIGKHRRVRVDLWVDRADGIYRSGERMVVYVRADQSGYLRLIYHDAAGNDIQIFPNRYAQNDYVEANRVLVFGDEDDPFKFTVVPPFGTEILKAFVSTERFENIPGNELSSGLKLITIPTRGIIKHTRGITVKKKEARFGEASCVITTVRRY